MSLERQQLNDSQAPIDDMDLAFYFSGHEMSQPVPDSKTEFNLSISQMIGFKASLSKGKL